MGDIVSTYAGSQPEDTNPAYRILSIFRGEEKELESLKIAWNGKNILEISPRHYPASTTGNYVKGLELGDIHYVFVHGQQFDDQQVTYTIGKGIGCRFDIIDTFQDLFNCSFIRTVCDSFSMRVIIGLFSLLTILSFILSMAGQDLLAMAVRWIVGSVVAVGFLAIFLLGIRTFGLDKDYKNLPSSPLLFKACAGLAIVELAALVGGSVLFPLGLFDALFNIGQVIFFWFLFAFAFP